MNIKKLWNKIRFARAAFKNYDKIIHMVVSYEYESQDGSRPSHDLPYISQRVSVIYYDKKTCQQQKRQLRIM